MGERCGREKKREEGKGENRIERGKMEELENTEIRERGENGEGKKEGRREGEEAYTAI